MPKRRSIWIGANDKPSCDTIKQQALNIVSPTKKGTLKNKININIYIYITTHNAPLKRSGVGSGRAAD